MARRAPRRNSGPTCDPRAVDEAVERYTALHNGEPPAAVECVLPPRRPRYQVELGPVPEERYNKEVRENGIKHAPLYRHEHESEEAQPVLAHDDQGNLLFTDGAYTVTAHGIEDVPMRQNPYRHNPEYSGVPYARSSQTLYRGNPAPEVPEGARQGPPPPTPAFPAPGSQVPVTPAAAAPGATPAYASSSRGYPPPNPPPSYGQAQQAQQAHPPQSQTDWSEYLRKQDAEYKQELDRAQRQRVMNAQRQTGRTFMDDGLVVLGAAGGLTLGGALLLQQTNWSAAGKSVLVGALGLGAGFLAGGNAPALALGLIGGGVANLVQAVFQQVVPAGARSNAGINTQVALNSATPQVVPSSLPDAAPAATPAATAGVRV